MSWATEEFRSIELGDKRLDARAVLLAERLADRPTASLPGACGGWTQTQAGDRFLAQRRFDWLDLLEAHRQCTLERLHAQSVALCIQDTTELDFNGQRIEGLGPLSDEAQRGMYLHPTLAVSPAREPLGVTDLWMWARASKDAEGARAGPKESTRWVDGYARVAELAEQTPTTRLVYVGDREADLLPLQTCWRCRPVGADEARARPGVCRRRPAAVCRRRPAARDPQPGLARRQAPLGCGGR